MIVKATSNPLCAPKWGIRSETMEGMDIKVAHINLGSQVINGEQVYLVIEGVGTNESFAAERVVKKYGMLVDQTRNDLEETAGFVILRKRTDEANAFMKDLAGLPEGKDN